MAKMTTVTFCAHCGRGPLVEQVSVRDKDGNWFCGTTCKRKGKAE